MNNLEQLKKTLTDCEISFIETNINTIIMKRKYVPIDDTLGGIRIETINTLANTTLTIDRFYDRVEFYFDQDGKFICMNGE